jgi:hypothetical protein
MAARAFRRRLSASLGGGASSAAGAGRNANQANSVLPPAAKMPSTPTIRQEHRPHSKTECCKCGLVPAPNAIRDFSIVGAYVPPHIVEQAKRLIDANPEVLLQY